MKAYKGRGVVIMKAYKRRGVVIMKAYKTRGVVITKAYKGRGVVILKAYKGRGVVIMKAYKGRGVVIMNTDKYHKECRELLHMEQFQKKILIQQKYQRRKYKMLCVRLSRNFQFTSTNEYIRLTFPQENFMEQPISTNSPMLTA